MRYGSIILLLIAGIAFGAFSYFLSDKLSLSAGGIAEFVSYGLVFVLIAFLFSFVIDKNHRLKATWIVFVILAIGIIWIKTSSL